MGVKGPAVATCFTNGFLLTLNFIQTNKRKALVEATSITFLDKRVRHNYKEYLNICLPTMFIIFLDWSRNEMVVLMTGEFGVIQQATHVVVTNMLFIAWGLPGGFQQAGTALIGKYIGAGNIEKA